MPLAAGGPIVFSAPEWTVRGEGSVHCGWAVQAGQPAEAEREALGDSLFGLLLHIRLETRSQLASPEGVHVHIPAHVRGGPSSHAFTHRCGLTRSQCEQCYTSLLGSLALLALVG